MAPATVYTPYVCANGGRGSRRTWNGPSPAARRLHRPGFLQALGPTTLADIGFRPTDLEVPPTTLDDDLLHHYARTRNTPSICGTSRMSMHLRFGTVSVRELVRRSRGISSYLNELIGGSSSCRCCGISAGGRHELPSGIRWHSLAQRRGRFAACCEGRTGYPLVDAGMRS